MKVALQLYSLKELTEKDFLGTIEKVGEIGYDGVEFAGYFGFSAAEIKKTLNKAGLEAMGAHVGYDLLMNDLDNQIAFAKELGLYSVVCPGANGETKEEWEQIGKNLNEIGKKFKENGIIFGYHNHAHEFKKFDGEYALDILYANSDPKNVIAEIDTYWVKKGNEDPAAYTHKYSGRIPVFHAKDLDEAGNDTNVGSGCIDFQKVADGIEGLEWIVVEQEAFSADPVECVKIGCENMKKIT